LKSFTCPMTPSVAPMAKSSIDCILLNMVLLPS
jgi:hypothetical protein